MPRISYIRPSDPVVDPGMAITDLTSGLLSGYVGEQIRRQNITQEQADAAYGNVFERRRRAITWNNLPQDVRGSTDSQFYQDMIMRGGDPMSVLRAHKERATDPVYGDQPTQKARLADFQTAVNSGLVAADDEATKEAIRKGQLTLGSLIGRRDTRSDKDAARAQELADRKELKAQTTAENAARANQLQQALGVNPSTPPTPFVIPTGITAQTGEIPGKPIQLSHPADVETAARILDSRNRADASQANAARDDERAATKLELDQQKLELAKERLKGTLAKRDLTPDQRTQLETALQTLNNPNATRDDRVAAYTTAWQMGAVPLDAAMQKPTAAARAGVDTAKQTLEYLRDLGHRLTGQNQAAELELYSKQFGIPMTEATAKDGAKTMRPNKDAILADYAQRLRAAAAAAANASQQLSPRGPTDVTDQLKALSDEELNRIITGR